MNYLSNNNYQKLAIKNNEEEDHDEDDDDEDDDDLEPDQEQIDEIKQDVYEFFSITNDVKKLEIAIRERKKRLKELNQKILAFMSTYDIVNLDSSTGNKLKYTISKRKEPLTQKIIKLKLIDYFKDENKVSRAFEYIKENRSITEVATLKKIIQKN